MKKIYLILAAAAGMTVASCTSDEYVGVNNPYGETAANDGSIRFGTGTQAMTRADFVGASAAEKLGKNFVVEGVKGDGSSQEVVYDHYNVNWKESTANTTTSNTNDWEYVGQNKHDHANISAQSIKYWDYSASQYDFIAYSKGTATAVYTGTPSSTQVLYTAIDPSKLNGVDSDNDGKIDQGAYTITGEASELAKTYIADLVTAYKDKDYNKVVQFKFRSLSAKVRVAIYETVPGYSVNNVVFYTAESTPATDGKAHLYTEGTDVFNEKGTYVVYYPTTGNSSATDNNKAHLSFTAATSDGSTTKTKSFKALDYTNTGAGEEVDENGNKDLYDTNKLYIGRSSNEATYAGENTVTNPNYYTVVIPNETGAVLNLKVNYTLVSTDGSKEDINVTGATAQVPKVYATWKSGYAYTYIFKISQNSNGSTNPGSPAGLYPITFDAVVMNDEVDGIQETITTVDDPSITTYAKGEMVTKNNEYLTGANIYVTVANGNELSSTNAKLYTVTIENEAAQTINEASVANALATATPSGDPLAWTVTDANGKKLTVTEATGLTFPETIAAADSPDGNAITDNLAMFTPALPTCTAVASGTLTSGKVYYTSSAGAGRFISNGTETADGTNYFEKSSTNGAGIYVFEYIVTPVAATYKAATGTYVSGTTYYTDDTTGTTKDTTGFVEGVTDVSSYYVLDTPAVVGGKYYKIIKVVD